jgi:citrate lyase subunit beta / citryl-CoA lyase
MRVHLLLPPDPRAFESADVLSADALWIDGDLNDVGGVLRAPRTGPALYVRPVGTIETIEAALDAVMPERPAGIVAPVNRGRDVQHLGAKLAVREAELDIPDQATKIIAIIAAPAAVFELPRIATASPRVIALAFDTAAFMDALGVEATNAAALTLARSMALLAAKAAGVSSILIGTHLSSAAAAFEIAQREGFDGAAIRETVSVAEDRVRA